MGIADHLVSREDLDGMLESGKFPPFDSDRPTRTSIYWGPYRNMFDQYYVAGRGDLVIALIERREIEFSEFVPDANKAAEMQALYDDLLAHSKGRPQSALEVAYYLTRRDFLFPSNDNRLLATLRTMFENPIALEGLSAAVNPTEGGPTAEVTVLDEEGETERWSGDSSVKSSCHPLPILIGVAATSCLHQLIQRFFSFCRGNMEFYRDPIQFPQTP